MGHAVNDHDRQLLELVHDAGLTCPGCDYALGRLEACRCPECGRGFTATEWPDVGIQSEIATWIRINGPVPCPQCRGLIGRNNDGSCRFCKRRLFWSDLIDLRKTAVRLRPMKRQAVRDAVMAWGVVIVGACVIVACALLPSPGPARLGRAINSVVIATFAAQAAIAVSAVAYALHRGLSWRRLRDLSDRFCFVITLLAWSIVFVEILIVSMAFVRP